MEKYTLGVEGMTEKEQLSPNVTAEDARPELDDVFSPTHSRMDLLILNGSTHQEKRILDEENLDYFLKQDFRTRIAVVCQPYSWAALLLSRSMFQLFTTLTGSMDELWDTVASFRSHTSDVEQAFSTCAMKLQRGCHEISYVFKYPEMKRGEKKHMWVIRQNGVYHQYDRHSGQSTWMLLLPNHESYNRDKILENMSGLHPLQPHLGFHFAYFDRWRWYMLDLEKEFHDLADDILNLEIEEGIDFTTMYDQMSTLRYIQKRLSPLVPILASHQRVLGVLQRTNGHLANQGGITPEMSDEFAVAIDSLHTRVHTLESNVQYLLSRILSTIETASDTISLKSQNTTEGMSHHMLRDSTAIRVITLVTLVYLPASFVAGFFGMGFFTIGDDGNGSWKATPYTWLYFAVAIPMTAMTLGYWRWKSCQVQNKVVTSPV